MHHYFEAITNTSGDSLIGYFARVVDPATNNGVTIAADNNGTPISTVSGVDNAAKTDAYGNLDFYVQPGTYHLDIYAPNATSLQLRVQNVAMNSTKGDTGAPGAQGDVGASDASFTTLAAMKAANPVAFPSPRLAAPSGSDGGVVNGLFNYQLGNFTGRTDVVQVNGVPLTTGALVRQNASSVTFMQAGTGAVIRDTQSKNRDTISVLDYGAKGDGVADDTASIRAALTYLDGINGGTLFFPKGTYKTTAPITIPYRIRLTGVGSHVGSLIAGTHAGNIFECVDLAYTSFDNLAFTGSGCTAIRQTGSPTTNYMEHLQVRDCHFYGQLAECIYGNLIFAKIVRNSFGYYGTVGASHRHLRIQGTNTNASNQNRVEGNRFYYAKGSESVRWDTGADNVFSNNNWEQNNALPLRLNGMPSCSVKDNWFELNNNTVSEIEINPGASLVDSTPTYIRGNSFVPQTTIQRLVQVNTTLITWTFDLNAGGGTGKQLTNDASRLISQIGNNLSGLPLPARLIQEKGSWNIVDASGAALAVSGVGTWERYGNTVTATIGFTFPANSNNANVNLGGLPYNCSTVAIGSVLSTRTGGVDIATNGSTNTMTAFAPGTLTPLNNSQLGGQTLYITITYPAPGF